MERNRSTLLKSLGFSFKSCVKQTPQTFNFILLWWVWPIQAISKSLDQRPSTPSLMRSNFQTNYRLGWYIFFCFPFFIILQLFTLLFPSIFALVMPQMLNISFYESHIFHELVSLFFLDKFFFFFNNVTTLTQKHAFTWIAIYRTTAIMNMRFRNTANSPNVSEHELLTWCNDCATAHPCLDTDHVSLFPTAMLMTSQHDSKPSPLSSTTSLKLSMRQ